jgi:flagellar L-ring protein precursor FlgH
LKARHRASARPATDNTVNLDLVAEARVSYRGQGQIMDVQPPRYGSQLYDIVMPF